MQKSKTIAQGSASQAVSALAILVVLGHAIPLLGIMLLPGVALATWSRAVVESLRPG